MPESLGGAATAKAQAELTVAHRPTLFLHLHKAGGTTACEVFRGHGVPAGSSCNCLKGDFEAALRAGNGTAVAAHMLALGREVCFVEKMWLWPAPQLIAGLAEHVRLITTVREPWERAVSNFERDLGSLCSADLRASVTIRDYMTNQGGCSPSVHRFAVQLPDFYVRSLNGQALASTSLVATMASAELEAAKRALAQFDEVLVLERPDFGRRLAALACPACPYKAVPHLSNNPTSGRDSVPDYARAARADAAVRREANGSFDAQLYAWAARACHAGGCHDDGRAPAAASWSPFSWRRPNGPQGRAGGGGQGQGSG